MGVGNNLIISIISAIFFALIYSYLSGLIRIASAFFSTSEPTKGDIYLMSVLVPTAFIASILVGINISLVVYNFKHRCRCKKGGILGAFGSIISMFTCCSPILVSLIGMGSAMLLAPFVGLFSIVGLLLLTGAVYLNLRKAGRLLGGSGNR